MIKLSFLQNAARGEASPRNKFASFGKTERVPRIAYVLNKIRSMFNHRFTLAKPSL